MVAKKSSLIVQASDDEGVENQRSEGQVQQ